MANASKGSNMSKGSGGRRSVGAAGGGLPNGAILNDDSGPVVGRSLAFKEWAKAYRAKKLKSNPSLAMTYDKSPSPTGGR